MKKEYIQNLYNLLTIQNEHLEETRKLLEYSININYAVAEFLHGMLDGLKEPQKEIDKRQQKVVVFEK